MNYQKEKQEKKSFFLCTSINYMYKIAEDTQACFEFWYKLRRT